VSLAGRVAFIAGASSRFARPTALAVAQAGADVVLSVDSGGEAAVFAMNSIANELWALDRRHLALFIDTSREDAAAEAVARGVAELGRIDLLVTLPDSPVRAIVSLVEAGESAILDQLRQRLGGVLLLCRAAGAEMLERDGGVILNVVSRDTRDAPAEALGAAAEAGIEAATRTLAHEWSGRIAVSVATTRGETEAEQVATLAAGLAASHVTGQVFHL